MKKKKKTCDWSGLPTDLLVSIYKLIECRIDAIRFRSVCHSWRNSVPCFLDNSPRFPLKIPHPRLIKTPNSFQLPSNNQINANAIHSLLSQTIIYLLKPIPSDSSSLSSSTATLFVKIEHHQFAEAEGKPPQPHKVCLFNLISQQPINHLRGNLLDLRDFNVIEICKSYTLKVDSFNSNFNPILRVNEVNKVIVYPDFSCTRREDCFALAITNGGKLNCWKFGDDYWTPINDEFCYYVDMIVYKEKFYVVDKWGLLSMIDLLSMKPRKVAAPTYNETSGKFLVESCGNLYLVDRYTKKDPNYQENNNDDRQIVSDFIVYKLNEEEHDWDMVRSIGDRMFSLGNSSFSFSALDFPIAENCIFFDNRRIFLGQADEDLQSKGL